MHSFHLPPEQCRGTTILLTEGEAHHAVRVLRVRPDERVVVLDGAGRELHCDVRECARNIRPPRVELRVAGGDERELNLA
jgi:16S rRNA (uracil1498-N3)-methyltransferase